MGYNKKNFARKMQADDYLFDEYSKRFLFHVKQVLLEEDLTLNYNGVMFHNTKAIQIMEFLDSFTLDDYLFLYSNHYRLISVGNLPPKITLPKKFKIITRFDYEKIQDLVLLMEKETIKYYGVPMLYGSHIYAYPKTLYYYFMCCAQAYCVKFSIGDYGISFTPEQVEIINWYEEYGYHSQAQFILKHGFTEHFNWSSLDRTCMERNSEIQLEYQDVTKSEAITKVTFIETDIDNLLNLTKL